MMDHYYEPCMQCLCSGSGDYTTPCLVQGQAAESGVPSSGSGPECLLGAGVELRVLRGYKDSSAREEMAQRAKPLVQICLEYGLTGTVPLDEASCLQRGLTMRDACLRLFAAISATVLR